MKITWNTDVNAPCCPGEIVADDGRRILIQTDWDYPGTASAFGWAVDRVQRHPVFCADGDGPCDDDDCPECRAALELLDIPAGVRAEECEHCGHIHKTCPHDGTDGTIDCPDCGLTATEFISAAYDWLRDNDGAEADDPGYFSEDHEAADLSPSFDRFDIAEAWYAFLSDYHEGQGSKKYARLSRLSRKFKPGAAWSGIAGLSDNAKEIYRRLAYLDGQHELKC